MNLQNSDALTKCYGYARDIDSGSITSCKKVKLACRRFLRDLERSKDPAYPWRFDEEKAARPCNFIERFLSPTKGDYAHCAYPHFRVSKKSHSNPREA